MGRNKGKKRPYGKNKNRNDQNERNKGVRGNWTDKVVVKENAAFEAFYKAQAIVPPEEWEAFMGAMREELPHSFRLCQAGSERESRALLRVLEERYFSALSEAGECEGYTLGPPSSLAWYPQGRAFQLSVPKKILRKHPLLHGLHTFLVAETELGNVSRQESVSMIPPLLLNVQPHHAVLDMCAAPGSKTAQLVEALHTGEASPTGLVVANDADNKRCYLLVHQALKRLNNAACLVLNEDAANFPNLYRQRDPASGRRSDPLRFDRILADVPCSGDGTLRKNLEVWAKWRVHDAAALHPLQLRIAKRGAELLAVGGRMVYSTCSLNPYEDEAVLVQLLAWGGGSLELVDVSAELPGLVRSPGISHWRVCDGEGVFYASPDEVPEPKRSRIIRGLFPPTADVAADMHLERAFRILPHAQNTGGFFVAVLAKTGELGGKERRRMDAAKGEESKAGGDGAMVKAEPGEEAKESGAKLEGAEVKEEVEKEKKPPSPSSPPAKRSKNSRVWQGHREAPFVFLTRSDEQWKDVAETYGLPDSFPAEQLLHRSAEGVQKRNLYLVNALMTQIIKANSDDAKVINAGLRIFGRVDQKYELSKFRLAHEGIHAVFPYITKRKVKLPAADVERIVAAERNASERVDSLSAEAQKSLEAVSEGSLCVWADLPEQEHREEPDDEGSEPIVFAAWRGKVTVSAYVEPAARLHILRMLGADTSAVEASLMSERKRKVLTATAETDSAPLPAQDSAEVQPEPKED